MIIALIIGISGLASLLLQGRWVRTRYVRRDEYLVVPRDTGHVIVDPATHFIVPRHDPATPVVGALSYPDVGVGYELLVADARKFGPTVIVAINRGGGQVGANLAHTLGMRPPYGLYINFDRGNNIEYNGPDALPPGARILITDDGFFTGDHMRAAARFLRKKYPRAEIHRVVLLARIGQRLGPESGLFHKDRSVDYSAFFTFDERAQLPWHLDRIDVRPDGDEQVA